MINEGLTYEACVQGSMLRASLSQSSSGLHSVREDRTVSRDRAGGAVFGGERLGMAFEEGACWGGKIEEGAHLLPMDCCT